MSYNPDVINPSTMIKQNPVSVRGDQEENRQVRHDLFFTLSLNGLFLALLVVLYFVNRSTGAVDNFFSNLFKF